MACVWYVSKYVITPENCDPAGRSFGIMREIARLGHRSVIVTSDSMGAFDAPQAGTPYALTETGGIQLVRLRTLKYASSKSTRRVLSWMHFEWRLLRLPPTLPYPDVIIVSSLSLLTVLNGLRLRRRFGARLVFEVRDIWPLTLTEEGGFSRWNPLVFALARVEKLGYRRADAIVGTMPNLGPHVEKVTGRPIPTHCIPMGLDTAVATTPEPLPKDFAEKYMPRNKFIVAYAGSIGVSNALDTLMECAVSMSGNPGVHFVVVGDGDLRQSYEDRYGSLPNLTFAPRLPKSMVQSFLVRCDLLYFSVHNSAVWDYGLSLNKLIDYMLAARPIVASYSGFPSMITEAECGSFVAANDVPALQNEVLRYVDMDQPVLTSMGERGRSWLLANRDYSVLARDYLRILLPEGETGVATPDAERNSP